MQLVDTPDLKQLTVSVKDAARGLGFTAVGIASAKKTDDGQALRKWIAQGYQADMQWMENPEVREDPTMVLQGARSVVVVGWNYYSRAEEPKAGEGRIARYALGQDYHRFLKKKLKKLLAAIQAMVPCSGRLAVDAFPLLERAFAQRAGIGWIGKHSCLIAPHGSSWLLLAEVILDIDLEHDQPHPNRCGTCSRCIPACPTNAITAPGVIDSNRCIAYLTVEAKGAIPRELRPLMGDWLFGCDLCQEACPWDTFAEPARDFPQRLSSVMAAVEFLTLTDEAFRARFSGTPLMRAGRICMARNAAIVLGNTRPLEARAALERALADSSPLVRGHAAWALGRYGAGEPLRSRLDVETDSSVREELELARLDAVAVTCAIPPVSV